MLVVANLAIAPMAFSQEGKPPLTIASFGGAFTRSQMIAYVQPYRERTNRWVNVEDYDGRLDEIRDQVLSANVKWDLVSMELPSAMLGCEEGLLESIDHGILPPAPDGTPAAEDFVGGALHECAVGFDIFATVVAYDRRRFDTAPTTHADFFDVDRFPGQRGLQARAMINMEWALIADGVVPSEVYDVLSTEEGLNRAFTVLDRIRDQVVWWRFGSEPQQLLATGRVSMSSAWNGRVFEEVQARDTPLGIIWEHQVWNMDVWVTPKGAPNHAEALDFIAFATAPERIAEQVSLVAYAPTRLSAGSLLPPELLAELPTAQGRGETAIQIDYAWWAANGPRVRARFDAWLRGEDKGKIVYDFSPRDAE